MTLEMMLMLIVKVAATAAVSYVVISAVSTLVTDWNILSLTEKVGVPVVLVLLFVIGAWLFSYTPLVVEDNPEQDQRIAELKKACDGGSASACIDYKYLKHGH